MTLQEMTDVDVHKCPPVVYDLEVLKHFGPKNHTGEIDKIHKDF